MWDSTLGILGLGFSLGLLHAFDADHIMAVSALTGHADRPERGRRSVLQAMHYCLNWSLGHGGILLLVALALTGFGISLPAVVHLLAERAIGVFLIVLGGWIVWQAWRHDIRLQLHQHGKLSHLHLCDKSGAAHNHQPVLVGMTHGLAGSAPVLALIPTLGNGSHVVAIGYVALFCVGVIVSMVLFGLVLGRIQGWLAGFSHRVYQGSRMVLGSLSMSFGVYWLLA